MHERTYPRMHVCRCRYVPMKARGQSWMSFFRCCPTYYWEKVSLGSANSPSRLDWVTREPRNLLSLHTKSHFYTGIRNLNTASAPPVNSSSKVHREPHHPRVLDVESTRPECRKGYVGSLSPASPNPMVLCWSSMAFLMEVFPWLLPLFHADFSSCVHLEQISLYTSQIGLRVFPVLVWPHPIVFSMTLILNEVNMRGTGDSSTWEH